MSWIWLSKYTKEKGIPPTSQKTNFLDFVSLGIEDTDKFYHRNILLNFAVYPVKGTENIL